MNRLIKSCIVLLLTSFMMSSEVCAQLKIPSDSVKQLLCSKSWHLVKLTDISGTGQNVGGEMFNIDTKFNPDGTIETTTAGKLTTDNWKLAEDGVSLETNQLKDPKTAQEKITIVEISDKILKVQITYRGNNIMQYDYN